MRTLMLLTALCALASPAAAEDPSPLPTGVLGAALHGSGAGPGLTLDGRLVLPRGAQVGLTLTGQAFGIGHFSGQTVHDVSSIEPGVVVLAPLVRAPGFELAFRFGAGARFSYERAGQRRQATRAVTEVAMLAHLRLRARGLVRVGALVGVELEVAPTVELADQTLMVVLSGGYAVAPRALLFASMEGGGSYGFGGDNGKVVLRGTVGLRVALSGDARTSF
jgi:hypothetical protein